MIPPRYPPPQSFAWPSDLKVGALPQQKVIIDQAPHNRSRRRTSNNGCTVICKSSYFRSDPCCTRLDQYGPVPSTPSAPGPPPLGVHTYRSTPSVSSQRTSSKWTLTTRASRIDPHRPPADHKPLQLRASTRDTAPLLSHTTPDLNSLFRSPAIDS